MTPEERVLALLDYEPCADTFTWEVPQDMRKRITDATRAHRSRSSATAARMAEGCSESDTVGAIAAAIGRATGTGAEDRDIGGEG